MVHPLPSMTDVADFAWTGIPMLLFSPNTTYSETSCAVSPVCAAVLCAMAVNPAPKPSPARLLLQNPAPLPTCRNIPHDIRQAPAQRKWSFRPSVDQQSLESSFGIHSFSSKSRQPRLVYTHYPPSHELAHCIEQIYSMRRANNIISRIRSQSPKLPCAKIIPRA